MKIIAQIKQPFRLNIKRKKSDIVNVELNAALAWELDCKEVDYELYS